MTHEEILRFWFEDTPPSRWWQADADFDRLVAGRYGELVIRAGRGELSAWRAAGPRGRLAEIIVLDQFPRNIHRDTPAAFAHDPVALVLAQEAVAGDALTGLSEVERGFLLMPCMHSESRLIHEQAEPLFRAHTTAETHDFELRHKRIIDRFGRYPHRNRILGRASSAEETQFLTEPGSSF